MFDLNDLKSKFTIARQYMDNRQVPVELLLEFTEFLEHVAEDPMERIYQNPDVKKFFFEEFLGGLCKRVSAIRNLEDQYLPMIQRMHMTLAELFVKEIERDNSDMADAMRYIFEYSSNLNQNLFQEEDSLPQHNVDQSLLEKLSPEEREWRKSFEIGTKVDAIKVETESNLKMWAKGEIIEINGDFIHILFENDLRFQSRHYAWHSPEIDRYNTKSEGDEWRLELKKGDLIDAFDSTKVWYGATVQDTEKRGEVLYLKVGFRVYHPEGNKEDDEKNKFFGWSERFDEWIQAYNPRIQKYQSFVKSLEDPEQKSSSTIYEDTVEDQMDMLLYSNPDAPVYAVLRRRCKSSLLVSFLNRFGELGGYKKILERIQMEGNDNLGLETVYYYIDCLAKSTCMFNKFFVNQFLPELEQAVKKKILTASEIILRSAKKDRIDGIVQNLVGVLLTRIKTYRMREQDKNLLNLEIGGVFLEQNFLEKRIDGVKIIHEVCKNTNLMTFQSSHETIANNSVKQQEEQFAKFIVNRLQEKKVLWQIFSKERGHLQLINRSEELLKLLVAQDALNDEELDFIWSATKIDETSKLEIYKVFNEISPRLRSKEISYIISQISQIPMTKIIMEEIELVYELAKRSRGSDSDYGYQAAEFLWNITLRNSESVDKAIVNQSAVFFADVIKNQENNKKEKYVEAAIQNLIEVSPSLINSQNSEGFLSLKILLKIIKDFQGSSYQIQQNEIEEVDGESGQQLQGKYSSKYAFIEHIEVTYNLLESFFTNFQHYMMKARIGLRKKLESEPNIEARSMYDKVLAERFIHSEQINERLEFIKYISQNSRVKVHENNLQLLWDELVVHSLFKQDQDLFFRWLKDAIDGQYQGSSCASIEDLIQFFRDKITSEDSKIYLSPSIASFTCIQSFFIFVNEAQRKLVRLAQNSNSGATVQQPSQTFTSYSNTTGQEYKSYSFTANSALRNARNQVDSDDEVEFHVLVPPGELEKIQVIWHIAVHSSDSKVTEKAIPFLIRLYTSVTHGLQKEISSFENQFLSICVESINHLRQVIKSRVEQPKDEYERVERPLTQFSMITSSVLQKVLPQEERQILRYIMIIKELIKNSEKDGTLGVRSHNSLFRGEYLHTIQVTNSLKSGTKYMNKIEVGVYSNTTLWDLRRIIGERVSRVYTNTEDPNSVFYQDTPCHPALIRLYRYTGCSDIKETENGRTLAELKFKPNEQITAFRRNLLTSTEVSLFNLDKTDISDRAKEIFSSWFFKFSIQDPDDPLKRVMTPATCAAFTRSCTEDNCAEDDSRIISLFETYDSDKDGKIQLDEFLEFYKNCCFEKEDIVRQNLMCHYIRYDLNKIPVDGDDEYLNQTRKSIEEMPRYKMANEVFYFDSIFSLLDLTGEVSNNAWSLLKFMSTNPKLYKRVLELEKTADFEWAKIFDSSNIYKMLYTLQIVEALLEEETQEKISDQEVADEDFHLKHDWIQRFLSLGGFQEILQLFHKSLDLLGQKQVDSLTKFEKNFLEYMLKLIRIFILSAYSSNDQSVLDLLKLVKKTSQIDNQVQEEKNVGTDEKDLQAQAKFTTPAKQVKGKFVKDQDKQALNGMYQPEISQDFLFGETLEEKPDPEKFEEQKQEGQQEQTQTLSAQQEHQQENENERFSKMANIMKQTGLGEVILNKIDFQDLQNQVLEVICLILGKKEINTEDIQIMENALSLWVTSLVKNDNLVDEFYNYKRSDEKSGLYGIRNAEDLILTGVYSYKSYKVREEFCNTLVCIATKVKSVSFSQLQMNQNQGIRPLVYLLDILKRNFPREDQYYATRECKQFFDLFTSLIYEYISASTTQSTLGLQVDLFEILREAIQKLKRHETKEKKGSIIEDKTLIGYFQLIEKLVGYLATIDKGRLNEVVNNQNLIHELFYENLFYNPSYSKSKVENKSKTKESRAACYSVFQKIVETLEPNDLADLFDRYLWPLVGDLPRPQKWNYVPSENTKSSQFCGIINLGCICYMISMLQQFFMVPQFRYQLLRAEDNSAPDIKEYKGRKVDDNLLRQLQKMFGYLELSEMQAFDPFDFCFAFKDFEGNPTNTALQQDSQEFLNIFFDRVEELLKPSSQRYLLESVFGGKVCSQLICQSCGNIRNILESFYNLSLPVKDRKSLEDSLQKMIEGSIINDYRCEACNQKVDVFKRSLIAETPNVLIVHLQRIIFNFDTFQNDKVNTRFEFPNILNLKEYSFKDVMAAENKPIDEDSNLKHLLDMQEDEFIYKLVGVNIHVGTAEHGHYYSLINTKRGVEEPDETKPEWGNTEKDQWREFNDEQIKYFTFSDLKAEAFGGQSGASNLADNEMSAYLVHSGAAQSYGKNAYMLIYERQNKKDLRVIEFVPEIHQSETTSEKTANADFENNRATESALACVDTADARADQEIKLQPVEKSIPYRKIEAYVPETIRMAVAQDNSLFLIDRLIYHESFFNMIKSVYKYISNKVILTQHQYKYDYLHHFQRLKKSSLKVGHKILFDLLAYYLKNTQMSDLTSSLQSIITFCDSSYSLSRGDESLLLDFIRKCYLDDNCQHFYKIIFECQDKTSRYYIGKITSFVINKAFQLYDESDYKDSPKVIEVRDTAETIITKFINALRFPECQKNWSRLEQFFKIIHDVGCGGQSQVEILLKKFDITVEIIDFILGNKSPIAIERGEKRINMGGQGHGNQPPYQNLVSFVCFITRFRMTPAMRAEEYLWDLENNPPPQTLLGYNLARDQGQPEKFPLTERAYQMVVHSPFIEFVLQEGIESEEVGKMLAHFCYKNLRLSKQVSKLLLHGISRNDIEKVKNYLDVVTQVALIRDDLQRKRLEWMFGFGYLIGQTPTLSRTNDEEPVTKVGIKVLSAPGDEVYQYRSSLIYDTIDDSLLHLLWRYKGRMDTYTVNCLYSLLNLISSDEKVAEYFAQIPGPTYFIARYTDWIKPYLNEQLIDARKGYAGSFSAQKEEIVVKALSLLEKYESYLNGVPGAIQSTTVPSEPTKETRFEVVEEGIEDVETVEEETEHIRNLIGAMGDERIKQVQHDELPNREIIRCNPQPYIIADVVAEKQLMSNDFDGVEVTVSQISCFYTESQPTGNGNLSLPKNLFRRGYYGPVQGGNNKAQEMQAQCIGNYFMSSKFSKGKKQGNYEEEPEGNQAEQDQVKVTRVIKDDDREWDKVNNRYQNEDDVGYLQDDENGEQINTQQPFAVQNQDTAFDQPDREVSYKIQVVEENGNTEDLGIHGSINYDNQKQFEPTYDRDEEAQHVKIHEPVRNIDYIDDQDLNDQQNLYEEEIIWPNQLTYCEDLVYKISVQNYRNFPVKISLLFRDSNEANPCNLYYPRGGMKAMVYSKQTRTLILLHKIIPDNSTGEIHKLVIETTVKETGKNKGGNAQVYPSQQLDISAKMTDTTKLPLEEINENDEKIGDELDNQDRINVSDSNIDATGGDGAGDFESGGFKQCGACTFNNDAKNTFCEICYTTLL